MPATHASLHDFSDMPVDHPMEKIDRQRLIGTNMMLSRVVLHEGLSVDVHQHANEQIVICLEGETRFTLVQGVDERIITLRAGQVLVIPPDVPHGAEALKRTVLIDCFSPPSETTGVDQT